MKNKTSHSHKFLWAWGFLFLLGSLIHAQMWNPEIDPPDKPFSYFAYPVDVIGFMDSREGTEITPEGYLYTGYGELMFFYGNPPQPVNQRIKTLYRGYLPIIQYKFEKEGVRYSITAFAYTLDGTPDSPLINFVRVEFENLSPNPRTVYWTVGTRSTAPTSTPQGTPDHRFRRPAQPDRMGTYEQKGVEFSSEWEYSFDEGKMLRDGQIFYFFPSDIPHEKRITLDTPYHPRWKTPSTLPTTPVGLVKFQISLNPEEKKSLDIKMPYTPLSPTFENLDELEEAGFDEYLDKTVQFWEKIYSKGMKISLPEEKVVNTFRANLAYDLIARDRIEDHYVQKVNEFQYDAFWLRDSSYIVRAYDVTGYHKVAEECLNFFLKWQTEEGNFISQNGQYDGWGQSLWAIGQHFNITQDLDFARKFFPPVQKAVEWLHKKREQDPLHLMPETTPGDNELITGHVTGHNFWALGGLKMAVGLAKGLDKTSEAQQFQKEYDDYYKHFMEALEKITSQTDGYIPPGLDQPGGQDWGNLLSVYPVPVLSPHHPWVSKTLEVTRNKYKEGIMTYGDGKWLHHYLTMKNTETEVIRGEQKKALQEFYSILVHTSSTHAGFEFKILPWGDRDFGLNLSPHGWFAAKFRTLLRNMLVREHEGNLHLCSVLSPSWVREGKQIEVQDAPTHFGNINFTVEFKKNQAVVKLTPQFHHPPQHIIFHIPWFARVQEVTADGQKIQVEDQRIKLDPQSRSFTIQWNLQPIGAMSYQHTVQEYKENYRTKYQEFLEKGEGR